MAISQGLRHPRRKSLSLYFVYGPWLRFSKPFGKHSKLYPLVCRLIYAYFVTSHSNDHFNKVSAIPTENHNSKTSNLSGLWCYCLAPSSSLLHSLCFFLSSSPPLPSFSCFLSTSSQNHLPQSSLPVFYLCYGHHSTMGNCRRHRLSLLLGCLTRMFDSWGTFHFNERFEPHTCCFCTWHIALGEASALIRRTEISVCSNVDCRWAERSAIIGTAMGTEGT